jgi:transcriptional regulator with GAF, ATPase, and Fis domain
VEREAAWFRFCGSSRPDEMAIRKALTEAGVQLTSHDAGIRQPCGIVCFDSVEEALFTVLRELRCRSAARVLALSAAKTSSVSITWRLLHAGADDALSWNDDGSVAQQIKAKLNRWCLLERAVEEVTGRSSLVGSSTAWRALVRGVIEAARFTTSPILLVGESGTGKEALAKLVNSLGQDGNKGRGSRELVTVDCGAIVPELSGSEFFGHERGAFTGAQNQREGAFALADGGTLFLDEIGEVPLPLQAQLLRAIQEKTYKRVGGNSWQSTDFRLVCATNRDLEELVRRGQFRLDLFYRIAGCVFHTPPLSQRADDILLLASSFLSSIFPVDTPTLDIAVREYLIHRSYIGNVRELRQLIHRIALKHVGPGPITAGDIPEEDRPVDLQLDCHWPNKHLEQSIGEAIAFGTSLKEISQKAVETAIRIALQSEQGSLQRAARRLGITDRALQIRRAAGNFPC